MTSLPSPVSAVNPTPVPYSQVHNLFIRLVLIAGRRHDKRAWLRELTDALRPLDDAAKLANLRRIEAELESEQ
jgi:hypothetical protein